MDIYPPFPNDKIFTIQASGAVKKFLPSAVTGTKKKFLLTLITNGWKLEICNNQEWLEAQVENLWLLRRKIASWKKSRKGCRTWKAPSLSAASPVRCDPQCETHHCVSSTHLCLLFDGHLFLVVSKSYPNCGPTLSRPNRPWHNDTWPRSWNHHQSLVLDVIFAISYQENQTT